MKTRNQAIVILSLTSVLFLFVGTAQAGDDWGFSINPGGLGFYIGDNDHHGHHGHGGHGSVYWGGTPQYRTYTPRYYNQGGYYPQYNPTVRRDYYGNRTYAPDGTVHQENVAEDRRASYYSPGRNQAITPPQTTVRQEYGPYGQNRTVERTTWIGADGLPHSTTVDRHSQTDPWGNTRTDTNVTLKNKQGGNAPKGDGPTLMPDQGQPDNQSNFSKPPSKAPSKKN